MLFRNVLQILDVTSPCLRDLLNVTCICSPRWANIACAEILLRSSPSVTKQSYWLTVFITRCAYQHAHTVVNLSATEEDNALVNNSNIVTKIWLRFDTSRQFATASGWSQGVFYTAVKGSDTFYLTVIMCFSVCLNVCLFSGGLIKQTPSLHNHN